MNSTFSDQDGVRTQEITEFHVHAVVPGKDPFPLANGTNQYPFPHVTVYYDTSQVVQDPKQCVSANNSVGFVCGVPRVDLRHQVLEVRLVRLLEFSDTNGDKGGQVVEGCLRMKESGYDRAVGSEPVSRIVA